MELSKLISTSLNYFVRVLLSFAPILSRAETVWLSFSSRRGGAGAVITFVGPVFFIANHGHIGVGCASRMHGHSVLGLLKKLCKYKKRKVMLKVL